MRFQNITPAPAQMRYNVVRNHVMMCVTSWGKEDDRMEAQYTKLRQAEEELLAWGTPQIENVPEKREDLISLIMQIPIKQ